MSHHTQLHYTTHSLLFIHTTFVRFTVEHRRLHEVRYHQKGRQKAETGEEGAEEGAEEVSTAQRFLCPSRCNKKRFNFKLNFFLLKLYFKFDYKKK